MITINFIAPNGEQLTKRHSLAWKKKLKIYLYVHGKFLWQEAVVAIWLWLRIAYGCG